MQDHERLWLNALEVGDDDYARELELQARRAAGAAAVLDTMPITVPGELQTAEQPLPGNTTPRY